MIQVRLGLLHLELFADVLGLLALMKSFMLMKHREDENVAPSS